MIGQTSKRSKDDSQLADAAAAKDCLLLEFSEPETWIGVGVLNGRARIISSRAADGLDKDVPAGEDAKMAKLLGSAASQHEVL